MVDVRIVHINLLEPCDLVMHAGFPEKKTARGRIGRCPQTPLPCREVGRQQGLSVFHRFVARPEVTQLPIYVL